MKENEQLNDKITQGFPTLDKGNTYVSLCEYSSSEVTRVLLKYVSSFCHLLYILPYL